MILIFFSTWATSRSQSTNILITRPKSWHIKRLTLRYSIILLCQLLIKNVIFSYNLFNLIKSHLLLAN